MATSFYDPNATSGFDPTYDGAPAHAKHRGGPKMEADHDLNSTSEEGGTADDLLQVLGYQSEMARTRSTWQVAFMSFVLASIPYGLSTTFYYPLVGGGPTNIIWGWVAVSLIVICVAVSLGEITSVYPTAGGVYYQAFMLSPPWCQRITAWICGWCYVLGNVTITLAVNFGTALFLTGCINIFTTSNGDPIFAGEPYQVFLIFLAVTLFCNAVSALGNKWLPILDVRINFFHTRLTHFFPTRPTNPLMRPHCSQMRLFAAILYTDYLYPTRLNKTPCNLQKPHLA